MHLEYSVYDSHFVTWQRLYLHVFCVGEARGADPVTLFDECSGLGFIVLVPDLVTNLVAEEVALRAKALFHYLYVPAAVRYHLMINGLLDRFGFSFES